MKASDFRIGNWYFDFEGNPAQIEAVEILAMAQCEVAKTPIEFVKPIPLTEEWLKKLGFTKQLSFSWIKDISYFPQRELKVISVTIGQGVFIRCGELNRWREDDEVIALINTDVSGPLYVHQLQNLFYSLTGSELELHPTLTGNDLLN